MKNSISQLLAEPVPDWLAVVDTALAEFGGSTGTLHRLDPKDNLLKLVAQRGVPEQIMPMITAIPIGKGIAGAAAERRAPVELCNLQADLGGVAKAGARKTNVQGSLAVPCLHQGELRGTLGVGLMTPHDFTEAEKAQLLAIAAAVAARL
jgi:L-methionine (R)-S-oxide reductase